MSFWLFYTSTCKQLGQSSCLKNVGPVIVQVGKNDLSDSCWHFVEIRRRKRRLTVIIDRGRNGRDSQNSSDTYSTLNLSNQSDVIYYGGGPREVLHFAQAKQLSFKGFLKQFKFEEFSVIDNALGTKQGFSITDTDRVSKAYPPNYLLKTAERQCNAFEASACSPGEHDSDNCRTSSTATKTKGKTLTWNLKRADVATEFRGPFLESPETFRIHFGWQNYLCIFKTKASRGTKLCSCFHFYFLYNIWKKQLYRISGSEF